MLVWKFRLRRKAPRFISSARDQHTVMNGGRTTRCSAPVILALLLGLWWAQPAAALTGDDLLMQCSSVNGSPERKQCESYIDGVFSGINTLITSMRILHPGSNSYPQLFCVPRLTATGR